MKSLRKLYNRNRLIVFAIIIIITAFSFGRDLSAGFVNYDDDKFITDNEHIANGLTIDSIRWAFTTTYMSIWHPITWLSHIVDYQLFGLNAEGHHFNSILIHLLNSLLLFLILSRLTGTTWRSALVAAIFAVHPLHVESVSWIAVRKDLVSTFFVFLSLRFYIEYANKKNWQYYLAVTLSFMLALMSKPQVIFLPILFFLLDFWPLRRLEQVNKKGKKIESVSSLIIEKIIWAAMSGLILFVNYMALAGSNLIASFKDLPLPDRLLNVPYVIFFYLYKSIYPVALSVFYPYPKPPGVLWALAGFLVLIALTVFLYRYKSAKPYLLFGWLWFLIGLSPVLGVVQQAQHLVADRYMYIPLIGLSVMLIWGMYDLLKNMKNAGVILPVLSAILIVGLSIMSFVQTRVWKDTHTLFNHALKLNPENHVAFANLGGQFFIEKNYKKAAEYYTDALEAKPYYANLNRNNLILYRAIANSELGKMYLRKKDDNRALEHFQLSLEDDSLAVASHYNIGNIYLRKMLYAKAIDEYRKALDVGGRHPDIFINLATALRKNGDFIESEELLNNMLAIDSTNYVAVYNLACLYAAQNKPEAAVAKLQNMVDHGFNNWELLKNSPDLDKIRDSRAYRNFLKKNNQ